MKNFFFIESHKIKINLNKVFVNINKIKIVLMSILYSKFKTWVKLKKKGKTVNFLLTNELMENINGMLIKIKLHRKSENIEGCDFYYINVNKIFLRVCIEIWNKGPLDLKKKK